MSEAQSASSRPAGTTERLRWKCSRPIRTTSPIAETCCSACGRTTRCWSVHDWGENVPDLGGQLVRREGLGQEVVQPDLAEALHDLDVAVTTHCYDRYIGLQPAQLPGGLGTAERWHGEVQKNEPDALTEVAQPLNRLLTVLGQLDTIASGFQHALDQCPYAFFIIGDENGTGTL